MSSTPPTSDRGLALILLGLACILLVMGGGIAAFGVARSSKEEAMAAWPSTEGDVVRVHPGGERPDDGTMHATVRYEVDGRSYEVTSWTQAGAGAIDPASVEHERVEVYYDPRDPSDASLTRELQEPFWPFVVLPSVCGLLSLPFLWFAVRIGLRAGTRERTAA